MLPPETDPSGQKLATNPSSISVKNALIPIWMTGLRGRNFENVRPERRSRSTKSRERRGDRTYTPGARDPAYRFIFFAKKAPRPSFRRGVVLSR